MKNIYKGSMINITDGLSIYVDAGNKKDCLHKLQRRYSLFKTTFDLKLNFQDAFDLHNGTITKQT